MKRIERIKIRIRKSETTGIFHDSRKDVRVLGEAINAIVQKQNEMIDTVNQLIDEANLSRDKG